MELRAQLSGVGNISIKEDYQYLVPCSLSFRKYSRIKHVHLYTIPQDKQSARSRSRWVSPSLHPSIVPEIYNISRSLVHTTHTFNPPSPLLQHYHPFLIASPRHHRTTPPPIPQPKPQIYSPYQSKIPQSPQHTSATTQDTLPHVRVITSLRIHSICPTLR
jgi:hypothetical protein